VVAPMLGLSLLCDCANYTHGVSPDLQPTGKEAFVYGRFHVATPPSSSGLDGHPSMGLVMGCDNKREYRIRFDDEKPLVAVAVVPSACWIMDVIFSDGDGRLLGTTSFDSIPLYNMRFEAGKAYYVGDFDGEITETYGARHFRITDARDAFEATTRALLVEFPNLRSTPAVDQMRLCLDREDLKRQRELDLPK
jgi:hypothetical protein